MSAAEPGDDPVYAELPRAAAVAAARRAPTGAELGLPAGLPVQKGTVYVGFSADLVHHGHVNIIRVARAVGRRVVVGLLTDEAIASYKRETIMKWPQRRAVVAALRGVSVVVPQETLDYVPNLRRFRPDYVVHGSDWRNGVQCKARDDAIAALAEWGGEMVEPEYTPNISTTQIIKHCHRREQSRRAAGDEAGVIAPELDGHDDRAAAAHDDVLRLAEGLEALRPLAYVAVSSDVMHHGVISVIREAAKRGAVVIGLLTDDAAERAAGHRPAVPYAGRANIYHEVKGVVRVVPQDSVDYRANLATLRPEFVVHGDDWVSNSQKLVREAVLESLDSWGGRLVETGTVEFERIEHAMEAECFKRVDSKEKEAQRAQG